MYQCQNHVLYNFKFQMVNILCDSIFDLHKNTAFKLFFGNVALIFIKSRDDLAIIFL